MQYHQSRITLINKTILGFKCPLNMVGPGAQTALLMVTKWHVTNHYCCTEISLEFYTDPLY